MDESYLLAHGWTLDFVAANPFRYRLGGKLFTFDAAVAYQQQLEVHYLPLLP